MTSAKVKILSNNNPSMVLGELEVADAYLYERVNDKYTFEIEYYEQEYAHLISKNVLIHSDVDDDYFRIAQLTETPTQNKYELTCEHVSYELNGDRDDEINAVYVGTPMEIANEILTDNETRFSCIYSDFNEVITFKTKIGPVRSRLIELAESIGAEIIFQRFNVSIVTRRGHDYGLTIELGKNLKDVTVTKVFNFDGTITQSFDIDFIDLNKIVDENEDPLEQYEFHLGDTVYLKIREETIVQRGIAVGFNPFRKELPTIELDTPTRGITEVISGGVSSGLGSVSGDPSNQSSHYYMEQGTASYSDAMIFALEREYKEITSITTGIIGGQVDGQITLLANPIKINGKYTYILVTPVEDVINLASKVSIHVIGKLK